MLSTYIDISKEDLDLQGKLVFGTRSSLLFKIDVKQYVRKSFKHLFIESSKNMNILANRQFKCDQHIYIYQERTSICKESSFSVPGPTSCCYKLVLSKTVEFSFL
jgi:hypothetical protein